MRKRARQTACAANLGQLGHAVHLYSDDFDGRFPWASDASDRYSPANGAWLRRPAPQAALAPMVHEVLRPYVKSRQVFECPADTGYDIDDLSGHAYSAHPSGFQRYGLSYSYRTDLGRKQLGPSTVAAPSHSPVLFDAAGDWHGEKDYPLRRYNVLFADGHVANWPFARMQWILAFPP